MLSTEPVRVSVVLLTDGAHIRTTAMALVYGVQQFATLSKIFQDREGVRPWKEQRVRVAGIGFNAVNQQRGDG